MHNSTKFKKIDYEITDLRIFESIQANANPANLVQKARFALAFCWIEHNINLKNISFRIVPPSSVLPP